MFKNFLLVLVLFLAFSYSMKLKTSESDDEMWDFIDTALDECDDEYTSFTDEWDQCYSDVSIFRLWLGLQGRIWVVLKR